MNAAHRRPLAAFLLVFAFACVVMANGLREQVVKVFVDSGGPRPLISAVVPDIVLGHSLRNILPGPPAPSTAEVAPASQSQSIDARPVTLSVHVAQAKPAHRRPHPVVKPQHHAATAHPATPAQAAGPAPTAPVTSPTPSTPSTPTTPAPGTGKGAGGQTGGGVVRPNAIGPTGLVANSDPSGHAVGSGQHSSHHGQWSHHDPGVRGGRGDAGKGDVRGFQAGPGDHGGPSNHSDQGDHGNRGHDPFRGGHGHGDHHGPPGHGDHDGGPFGHGDHGDHGGGPFGHGDHGDHGGSGSHRH